MSKERLVPLSDAEETEGWPLDTCNWCERETRAVVALEHQGKIHRFFGMCGNHAETFNVSNEWNTKNGVTVDPLGNL